jgi:DNA-binding NarL/FixJ family response regulator
MLSDRQREVTLLVAEGLSNKEIARRLEISEGTVRVHLQDIYSKLGIHNRTQLAALVWGAR